MIKQPSFPSPIRNAAVALLLLASASATAQNLGTAATFAVLGATPSVTNTGPTVVSGSVGIWPAASITGFPPGLIVPGTGTFHAGNAVAQQAQSDTTAAYLALAGMVSTPIAPALGGQTLTPGVYNAGAADLTGTLTLDGPGLYVIQTTALTTASGPAASRVVLINGASACNVFWQVGSSASIGTFSVMQGNILALTSITIATSAILEGRALARNGTVTMDSNVITPCGLPLAGGLGPNPTPTLSEWAMILLVLLMATVGMMAMRRRGG